MKAENEFIQYIASAYRNIPPSAGDIQPSVVVQQQQQQHQQQQQQASNGIMVTSSEPNDAANFRTAQPILARAAQYATSSGEYLLKK
jgi:negative regulator of replication initiation